MNIDDILKQELQKSTKEYSFDILEIGIDEIMTNKIIDEIPIVKTIKQMYDIGSYFKKRRFIKNICIFLSEYNNISDAKKNAFIGRLENKRYSNEVVEILLLYLEECHKDEKAQMVSKAFVKYVEKEIEWDEFEIISSAIDKLNKKDISMLVKFYKIYGTSTGVIDANSESKYDILFGYNNLQNTHCISKDMIIETGESSVQEESYSEPYFSEKEYKADIVAQVMELGTISHEGEILAKIAIEQYNDEFE